MLSASLGALGIFLTTPIRPLRGHLPRKGEGWRPRATKNPPDHSGGSIFCHAASVLLLRLQRRAENVSQRCA